MNADLEQVAFRQVVPPANAPGIQLWELIAPDGTGVFARAEIFPGEVQWGVRLQDRAPALEAGDLLRLVAKLLVWHVHCPAETVDVVLGRTHEHHTLVRVGGDYM